MHGANLKNESVVFLKGVTLGAVYVCFVFN